MLTCIKMYLLWVYAVEHRNLVLYLLYAPALETSDQEADLNILMWDLVCLDFSLCFLYASSLDSSPRCSVVLHLGTVVLYG